MNYYDELTQPLPYFCQVANDLLRADAMNADAIYVRGLCLYYEDNVDKAFTHFQQVRFIN